MANPTTLFGFVYKYRMSGAPVPPLVDIKCGTSATFASGDPLAPNAYGYYAVIGSAAIVPHYIAVEDAAAVDAATVKKAIPILHDQVWEARCTGTPTQAMVGTVVDIEGSTGVFGVNENASSNDTVRILDLAEGNESNTWGAYAKVLVSFNKTAFAGGLSA